MKRAIIAFGGKPIQFNSVQLFLFLYLRAIYFHYIVSGLIYFSYFYFFKHCILMACYVMPIPPAVTESGEDGAVSEVTHLCQG